MMDLQPILGSIITLFILIAVGFLTYRTGFLTRPGITGLSSLVVNVSLPCLIIESMQIPVSESRIHEMIQVFSLVVLYYLMAFVLAYLISRFLPGSQFEKGVFRFMLIFSNLGFMGYPVSLALFGKESLFYVSLINLPFGILVFTIGIFMMRPDLAKNPDLKKIINPGLCASILGLFLFIIGFTIPSPLSDAFSLLGSVTTPVAMIIIGALLATMPIGSMVGDIRIGIVSLSRLLVIPLLFWLVARIFISDPVILGVSVLLAAMPVAANSVLIAEEYGVNSELASKGVFISTLLSIITIPAIEIIIS